MRSKAVRGSSSTWAHPLTVYLLPLYLACMLAWVTQRLNYVPPVQPADSSPTLFSEARALQHVHVLATHLVDRQVSMPGLKAATRYLTSQLEGLQQLVAGRQDVNVTVDLFTVSGAASMTFLRTPFTNAYRALDNVALLITPAGTEHLKAVLVASHHDSAVCSQGAADDAAQASVMLEAARALLSQPRLPPTPIIMLWTGGEEPISQAAHGWMSQSSLYSRVGAFINLEAMGGGGLPILFQHTGSWVLEAYARGSPLPRGSRVAQDVFDLHIMPADSDFRMFSVRHYGSLPGVDCAFILDSTAYHSYLDAPARIKPGIVQEMGESLLGGLRSVSKALAARQQQAANSTMTAAAQEARERADARQLAVYFDVLAYFMVVYSDDLAYRIHNLLPLIIAALPLLMYPPAGGAGKAGSLRQAYGVVGQGAWACLASMLLAVGLPVGLGAARTLVSGKPMVWFAHHWLGYLQYLPAGAVGTLLPWLAVVSQANQLAPDISEGAYMALLLQGVGLAGSAVGALLTHLGMTGNATLFVMNSVLAAAGSLIMTAERLSTARMCTLLAVATLPVTIGSSVVAVFIRVMMERMALGGDVHPVLADCIVGALSGLGVLAATCGLMQPLMMHALKPGSRRLVLTTLTTLSLATAGLSSAYWPSYTPHAPKRTVISHLIQTRAAATAGLIDGAHGTASASGQQHVPMEVVSEAISLGGSDSTPITQAVNMSKFKVVPVIGHERAFTPLYPLHGMLRGVLVAVPDTSVTPIDRQMRYKSILPTDTKHTSCTPSTAVPDLCAHGSLLAEADPAVERVVQLAPYLQLVSVSPGRDPQHVRLQLRLFNERPSWGILNVTSPSLVQWSFTSTLSPGLICDACGAAQQHVIRFTTQDPDPLASFWLELKRPAAASTQPPAEAAHPRHEEPGIHVSKLQGPTPDSALSADAKGMLSGLQLRVELSVTYLQRTLPLRRVLALLPEHVVETWLATVYQSYWEL